MLVSIIIPLYKRTEWIEKTLYALSRQENTGDVDLEILVIDDGSPNSGQIKDIVSKFQKGLNIKYFYQEQKGPAAAKNLGINRAKGEIICFIDDDSIPHPSWLHSLLECFSNNSSAGIVNGQTLSYHQEKKSLPKLLESSIHKPQKRWATYNIAYRRETLNSIGIFDESYKLPSWEDNDLGFRAWVKKIKHLYCPKAVVYHPHEKTLEELKKKSLRNGAGLGVFIKKFIFSYPHFSLGLAFYIIKDIYLALHPRVLLANTNSKESLKFIWAIYTLAGCIKEIFRWKQD